MRYSKKVRTPIADVTPSSWTGMRILAEASGLDILVAGIGTGGTMAGIMGFLRDSGFLTKPVAAIPVTGNRRGGVVETQNRGRNVNMRRSVQRRSHGGGCPCSVRAFGRYCRCGLS